MREDPNEFTGHALIDEDYMRSRGITGAYIDIYIYITIET
mgnify:CR=1 FL=1